MGYYYNVRMILSIDAKNSNIINNILKADNEFKFVLSNKYSDDSETQTPALITHKIKMKLDDIKYFDYGKIENKILYRPQ